MTSQDAQTVRGAYLVMEPAAWWVLVPLAFASLITGLVMSLGTTWGHLPALLGAVQSDNHGGVGRPVIREA